MAEAGRPPIYTDPLVMEERIQQYFDTLPEEGLKSIPTIAGLALHLGFNSRGTLTEYGKKDEFSDIVSHARTLIEVDRNQRLVSKEHYTPGLPMDLANHHNYLTGKEELSGKDGGPIKTASKVEWVSIQKPARSK